MSALTSRRAYLALAVLQAADAAACVGPVAPVKKALIQKPKVKKKAAAKSGS